MPLQHRTGLLYPNGPLPSRDGSPPQVPGSSCLWPASNPGINVSQLGRAQRIDQGFFYGRIDLRQLVQRIDQGQFRIRSESWS